MDFQAVEDFGSVSTVPAGSGNRARFLSFSRAREGESPRCCWGRAKEGDWGDRTGAPMGAGYAFRHLISEPSWRAEAIAIHSGSAQSPCGAVPTPPTGRTRPSLGKWHARGEQSLPPSWGRHISGKEIRGPGAKAVRTQETPGPGCQPLCGSHLSS